MDLEDIDAEFLLAAEIVHLAVDLYLISFELLPVNAIVAAFTSIIVPETVGSHKACDAMTIRVHLLVPIAVVPLYVVQVNVHMPVLEFGISA